VGDCSAPAPHLTTCNLGCDSTHTLLGSLSTTCSLGSWTNVTGVCNPNCASLPPLSTNAVAGTCTPNYPSGQGCALDCDVGYAVSGSLATQCQSDGTWTPFSNSFCFACGANCATACSTPPTPPEGFSAGTCVTGGIEGKTCTLECNRDREVSNTGSLTVACSNGEWTSPSAKCIIPKISIKTLSQTPTAAPSIGLSILSFIFLIIGLIIYFGAWFRQRKHDKNSQNNEIFRLFLCGLALADFFSDLAVLIDTNNRNQDGLLSNFVIAMVIFLVVPLCMNAVSVGQLIIVYVSDSKEANNWIRNNIGAASIVGFLSFFNSESILLISSKCFDLKWFSAPTPSQAFIDKVELSGVFTNVFEDIPQLAIQIVLAISLGNFPLIIAISVTFSLIAVAIALVRRFLVFSLVSADKVHKSQLLVNLLKESEQEHNSTAMTTL
jgi:hypothetical protein